MQDFAASGGDRGRSPRGDREGHDMIENVIEEEAEEVAGQFEEEVSLSLYDLRHTYCEFTVSKVDGCTPSHMLIVSFYDFEKDVARIVGLFEPGSHIDIFDEDAAEFLRCEALEKNGAKTVVERFFNPFCGDIPWNDCVAVAVE